MKKGFVFFGIAIFAFVLFAGCKNSAGGGDSYNDGNYIANGGGGGSSGSAGGGGGSDGAISGGVVSNKYFWGKWTRMDNGVEYEIREDKIYSNSSSWNITSATANSFACSLGTFERQSDNVMLLGKIPIFRKGGSNIEYTVTLVGFANNPLSRAATAASTAVPIGGQAVKNTTTIYPSYEENVVSNQDGTLTLHSPVAGTANTIHITASDGSLISATVMPNNSGEHAGTIPVAPYGMYALKVTGEISSDQTKADDGYLYAGKNYNMVVKIENITEFAAETSVVTIEPSNSNVSISGSTQAVVSTLTAHQVKNMNISVRCKSLSVPYIDTSLKVTFEDSSLARNVWVDYIPLRFFSGNETIQIRAESTEGNKTSALNGFVMYPDGNSQHFSVPHGQTKNISVPSFPATEPYKLSFCGATTGETLSDSTEMKYSIGVNATAPSVSGMFGMNEILAYEPNDTENKAASLGTADTAKAYLKKGDIDYYSVAVSSYRPKVNYTVEHHLENTGSGYSRKETETLTGGVGLKTMAAAKPFAGFTAQAFNQVVLQEGESPVIKIYYDRIITNATFDANGGSFSDGSTKKTVSGKYGTNITTPSAPTRTGYTFAGWQGASGMFPAEDTTYYAKWTATPCTITYNLNGGTNAASNPATYTIESATITLAEPTKNGYTFAGWYEEIGFATKKTQIESGSTGNVVLYAKWTAIPYSITYNLNGGTNAASNPANYTIESATIALAEPTKNGYTFAGWYEDSGFATQKTQIAKGSTGNIALYAKWLSNEVSISVTLPDPKTDITNLSYINNSGVLKFTAQSGYSSYAWYVDNVKISGVSANTYNFDTRADSVRAGTYLVMVVVKDASGKIYSSQAQVAVSK